MSICKACASNVVWKREAGTGKWQCFERDGITVHWDQCSQRKFEAIKRTGTLFQSKRGKETVTGYFTSLKKSGEQLVRSEGIVRRGDLFKRNSTCQECIPPWEICTECPATIVRPQ